MLTPLLQRGVFYFHYFVVSLSYGKSMDESASVYFGFKGWGLLYVGTKEDLSCS